MGTRGGVGRDQEDGALSGAALVWSISSDREIGTGESFTAQLSAGAHTVTLTVTDADENTDSDSIDLTITL